jgi:hypothetical protein
LAIAGRGAKAGGEETVFLFHYDLLTCDKKKCIVAEGPAGAAWVSLGLKEKRQQ